MFQSGGIAVALVDALLCFLIWRRLRAALSRRAAPGDLTRTRVAGVACAALFGLCAHPALLMAVWGWSGMRALQRHLPDSLSMFAMGAQVGLLLYGLFWGIGALASLALRAVRRARTPITAPEVRAPEVRDGQSASVPESQSASMPEGQSPSVPEVQSTSMPESQASSAGAEKRAAPPSEGTVDPGRRRIVAAAAWVLPSAAFGISMGGVVASRQGPIVKRITLPVRRELTSLHGITIAQLSDVHVGNFMDAERLAEVRDAMNALRADFHVVTGDLLDNHVSQLDLSTRLLRDLRPARGQLFFCMGNHEYIAARSADVPTIVKGIEDTGAQVLVDEAREVRVGGDRLWMGAIDFPSRGRTGETRRRPTREGLLRALAQMKDDGAPRILLSHHPRTFVEATDLPFDLMLSGHTHGGQISLGRIGDYALTPMLPIEHHHNGLYTHGPRRLYVNAGAGGWLPVRLNCPPEITLVELVPA